VTGSALHCPPSRSAAVGKRAPVTNELQTDRFDLTLLGVQGRRCDSHVHGHAPVPEILQSQNPGMFTM
jgi:hypothetical protein